MESKYLRISRYIETDKIKDFIRQNKKIVFPVAILLVIFVAAGIYFISQSDADKNENVAGQSEQKTEVLNDESRSENKTDESKTQGVVTESQTQGSDEIQLEENGTGSQASNDKASDKNSNNSNNSNSVNNNSGSAGNSNGSGDWLWDFNEPAPDHEHVWVTNTETKEETYKEGVTAEKNYYTLYRFYWHNTHKWEESRDHKRFDEWYKSEYGGFFYAYHPYDKPEDDPLFIEYDSNGNPVYTNDHAIISNLFEWVPCEPYEKTETREVTVTTITCSICGAVK